MKLLFNFRKVMRMDGYCYTYPCVFISFCWTSSCWCTPQWPHGWFINSWQSPRPKSFEAPPPSRTARRMLMFLWTGPCLINRLMWVKQCHKPPIWEWIIHVYTTYLMVIRGVVYSYVCFLCNYWSLRLAMKIMKRSFRDLQGGNMEPLQHVCVFCSTFECLPRKGYFFGFLTFSPIVVNQMKLLKVHESSMLSHSLAFGYMSSQWLICRWFPSSWRFWLAWFKRNEHL